MNLGIIGSKIGMSHIFNTKGNFIPVTLIKVNPNFVTYIKTKETCGYNAIQLGYIEVEQKKITKPESGHLMKRNLSNFKYLKEFKTNNISSYNIGDKIDLSLYKIGDLINISSYSIGKGTTGNIKLHHFKRGPMSHGSKHHRLQGSIGAGTTPGRVFPGKKMPKRSGAEKRTIKNLEIIHIFYEESILLIKGSIPGKKNNIVYIQK